LPSAGAHGHLRSHEHLRLQNGDADIPGHLSIYSKVLAEWAEPKEITANGEYTLKAAEISDEAYRITLADFGVVSEYLLIENRQPLEFDINIWAPGLVIYHVDTAADEQMNLGFPGQDGWPENGECQEGVFLHQIYLSSYMYISTYSIHLKKQAITTWWHCFQRMDFMNWNRAST